MSYESIHLETAYFTNEEQTTLRAKNDLTDFESRFGFLNSHNGLRRGKMHLFLAPTGVGKSTFIRSIIGDLLLKNKAAKIFVWITEETCEEFKTQLSYGMPSNEFLKNIAIFSELDNKNLSVENQIQMLNELQNTIKPDVVLCDNITTSRLYLDSVADQRKTAMLLKNISIKTNSAVFVIAHTGSDVRENGLRLIDENDIKGTKYITTISEFLYILQPVWVNQNLFQFLKVKKHRGQQLLHSLYFLVYDQKLRAFSHDLSKNYSEFIEIFSQRNKLK